jgi:hypothetical protein
MGIEFLSVKHVTGNIYVLLPDCRTVKEYIDFLTLNKEKLLFFREGLKENTSHRQLTIRRMLENFNQNCLQELNFGTFNLDVLTVKPLLWEDLKGIVLEGQVSRKHLGELLTEIETFSSQKNSCTEGPV